VTNVQNERHAEDPEHFPRTAETAYTMGPEAAPILVDHDRGRLRIVAIYHSHPQHDAYFSAEDRKQATIFDEPSYPDAAQIVVSIYDRKINAVKAFGWSEAERDFQEITLVIDG
jgi:proteasome lid subunit RPN8/RPN11